MQNHRAADREAAYRAQSHHLGHLPTQAEKIREECSQRKPYSEDVQPHWCVHWVAVPPIVEAELKQHCGQSDSSHNDHSQWAKEGAASGIEHDHTESAA